MRSLKLVNSVTWHDGNYIAYLEKIESDDKKTAKKKKKKTFTQPIIKKKKKPKWKNGDSCTESY